ncbi:MAG: GC-type dockerin domain-anchored protein [Planctomycetota bacterium]
MGGATVSGRAAVAVRCVAVLIGVAAGWTVVNADEGSSGAPADGSQGAPHAIAGEFVRSERQTYAEIVERASMLVDPIPRPDGEAEVPTPGRPTVPTPTADPAAGELPGLWPAARPTASFASADTGGGLAHDEPGLSFLGAEDNLRVIPPDTTGDVGPGHVFTILNSDVVIRTRDGELAAPPVDLTLFFASVTPTNETCFDPRVQYDRLLRRWVVVAACGAYSETNHLVFAISDTADPTGGYRFFAIRPDASGATWADFPALGINSRWIVVSANMFHVEFGLFMGAQIWVIDKETLDLSPPRMRVLTAGFDQGPGYLDVASTFGGPLMPATSYQLEDRDMYLIDNTGFTQPDGTELIRLSRLRLDGDRLVWELIDGGPYPGTGFFEVPISFARFGPAMPQKGSTYTVAGGDARVGSTPKFRNGRLWATHHGGFPDQDPDRTAVFWYELDPAAMEAGYSPIVQAGMIDDGPGTANVYPSIAVNAAGDAIVGFTRSSTDRYFSGAYAMRLAADPPGEIRPTHTSMPGRQIYSKARWGDYSESVVDPLDDTTLWTVQMYADELSLDPIVTRWAVGWTRVGEGIQTIFACLADMTSTGAAIPGLEGYGSIDGIVDHDDLSFYVGHWFSSNPARADLTTAGASGEFIDGFSVPDGHVSLDDLGHYLAHWLDGCP